MHSNETPAKNKQIEYGILRPYFSSAKWLVIIPPSSIRDEYTKFKYGSPAKAPMLKLRPS